MGSIVPQINPDHNPSRTKFCTSCQMWKPFHAFRIDRKASCGLSSHCKKCCNERQRSKMSPHDYRRQNLKAFYGMTPSQYDRMLAGQGGVCAACGQPETTRNNQGGVRTLSVDHNHLTGEIRGLLCTTCNISYGMLQESPDRIRKLLAYAERIEKREPSLRIIQLRLIGE